MADPSSSNVSNQFSSNLSNASKAVDAQQQANACPLVCIILDSQTGSMEPVPVVDLVYEKKEEPFVIVKMLYSTYSKLLGMLQKEAMEQVQENVEEYEEEPQKPVPTKKHKPTDEDDHIKGSWTDEEDRKLVELVKKHGPRRWSFIADHLKGRIGKQCRERYLNHLSPEINKKAWTAQEDATIIELHSRMGNQWAKIARQLTGRTANAVKNHWNSTLSRRLDKHKKPSRGSANASPDTDDNIHTSIADAPYFPTTTVETPTPVYTATIGTAPNSPSKTSVKFIYDDVSHLLSSPQTHLSSSSNQTKRGREPDMALETPERPSKRSRQDDTPSSPKTPGGSLRLETEEKMFNPFGTFGTQTPSESPNYKMSAVASRRDQFNKNLTLDIVSDNVAPVPAPSAEGFVEFSLPDTPQNYPGGPECGITIDQQQSITSVLPTPSSISATPSNIFAWSPRLLNTPKNDVNSSHQAE